MPKLKTILHNLRTRATAAWREISNPAPNLTLGQYAALSGLTGPSAGRKRPPTDEIQDLPVNTAPLWNVAGIQAAVSGHMAGSFGSAALLTEAMLGDDRVQTATNGRVKGVTKCLVTMQPSKIGDEKTNAAIADDIEAEWPQIFNEETLEQLLIWTIFMGFALCELVWTVDGDKWKPRLKVWHPLYVWYNIAERRYIAITMQGSITIEPNDPKWFLYTPYGAYRGWMRGAVRACGIPWIVRQFGLRDWARYSEVHGLPQKKVKYPAQAPAEAKASFFASIKRLGAETAFALPQQAGADAAAWDVELLEARDRAWECFPGIIGQCDSSITLAIRGTTLTTEVKTVGANAAAQTHREEDTDYAVADRKKLAAAIKKQVLSWYCLYNYGSADMAPTPVMSEPVETDRHDQALGWAALAPAVKSLRGDGWPIDVTDIAEQYGIPLVEGEEVTPPKSAETDAKTEQDLATQELQSN